MKVLVIALMVGWLGIGSARAEGELSIGIGTGALTAGFGANVGMRGNNSFGYLAAGCIGFAYSDNDGWSAACGVGAGWIRTDLFTSASNRHGFGIYAGPVGTTAGTNAAGKARYGAGLTYVHFFEGVSARGLNLGITPTVGKKYGDYVSGILFHVGYQF